MAKLSPMYDLPNENLVRFGVFHKLLSVDESVVPYYGCYSEKMFIKGKPIRFGYKIWCLCGNDGCPYHLKLYQAKEQNKATQPLGTCVITNMLNVITAYSNIEKHQLYFDNFFTCHELLVQVSEHDAKATGTTI